jgi:hypothetical protein
VNFEDRLRDRAAAKQARAQAAADAEVRAAAGFQAEIAQRIGPARRAFATLGVEETLLSLEEYARKIIGLPPTGLFSLHPPEPYSSIADLTGARMRWPDTATLVLAYRRARRANGRWWFIRTAYTAEVLLMRVAAGSMFVEDRNPPAGPYEGTPGHYEPLYWAEASMEIGSDVIQVTTNTEVTYRKPVLQAVASEIEEFLLANLPAGL